LNAQTSKNKTVQKGFQKSSTSRQRRRKAQVDHGKACRQEKLDEKHRDHKLIGNFKDRRECHIEPDWLVIYKIEGDKIIFETTGSHSDLFK